MQRRDSNSEVCRQDAHGIQSCRRSLAKENHLLEAGSNEIDTCFVGWDWSDENVRATAASTTRCLRNPKTRYSPSFCEVFERMKIRHNRVLSLLPMLPMSPGRRDFRQASPNLPPDELDEFSVRSTRSPLATEGCSDWGITVDRLRRLRFDSEQGLNTCIS